MKIVRLIICLSFLLTGNSGAATPVILPAKAPLDFAIKKRALPEKPGPISIGSNVQVDYLIVKFKDEHQVRFNGSSLYSRIGSSTIQTNRILRQYLNSLLVPLIKNSSQDKLEAKLKYLSFKAKQQLADFNSYYKIEVQSPVEAENLINSLNQLDIVEIAYFQPKPEPAGIFSSSTLPNYQPNQDYREAAPDGIDADFANTLAGGNGTGVKIIDIEGNWNFSHIDLSKAAGAHIAGDLIVNPDWRNHGTAVIGELIADDDSLGVVGICPGADIGTVSIGSMSTSAAILTAIDNLNVGDMILIELHAPGPHFNFNPSPDQLGYVCMEYWQDIFDAIQYAWAAGIVVIEAGGNGAEDFGDADIYGQLFDTTYRNSHAIIVGAGHPPVDFNDLELESFSNYGERVNIQGYGSNIYTTGYGGLYNGGGVEDSFYTATFGGTSGASPIVTGAAACLQGRYKELYGTNMTSDQIRDIIVSTGTLQKGNLTKHIGPRPDLLAAFAALNPPASIYAEPIFIDTTLNEDSTAIIQVWLHNRSNSDFFDFEITSNDSLTKLSIADWLQVSPATGIIIPLDSVEIEVTLDATLIGDRIAKYKGVLEIYWGVTAGAKDSLILLPVFLEVPCIDTSYYWISSKDSNDLDFNWVSARDLGLKVSNTSYYGTGSNPLDDGTTGPWAIGFTFPFYDGDYNSIYIGVNGALSFTNTDLNFNGYFGQLSIPNSDFSTLISVFWNDLIFDTDLTPSSGLYLYRSPTDDTLVIEWYKPGNFVVPFDSTANFEIILTADGRITMQYLHADSSNLNQTAVIGIAAIECAALNYFDKNVPPENIVNPGDAVQFVSNLWDYALAGDVQPDGATNILDLTFMVDFIFRGGDPADPFIFGDANCDGVSSQILDLTYLVDFIFRGGPPTCHFILRH